MLATLDSTRHAHLSDHGLSLAQAPIQGEADADVKSLGITNGDLLWVLSPKPTQPPAVPGTQARTVCPELSLEQSW